MRRRADAPRWFGRVGVAVVLVPALLGTGATGGAAGRAAAADAASVVEFDDAIAPAGGLAPMVEQSRAASPRSRFVEVDTDALLAELAGDGVTFELFEGVAGVFDDRGGLAVGVDGNATWSGTTATATATLSFAVDGVRGSIQMPNASNLNFGTVRPCRMRWSPWWGPAARCACSPSGPSICWSTSTASSRPSGGHS